MSIVKDNLPIFGIAKASKLIDYATTESDVSRGISRMPLVLARIYEEDIKFDTKTPKSSQKSSGFRVSPSAMQNQQLSEADKLMSNLNTQIESRISAHRTSIDLGNQLAKSMDRNALNKQLDADIAKDEVDFEAAEKGELLFRRGTISQASWDEFELISIIGRGTFGKVYLVRLKNSEKYFAMKCIRKDVVIKHESIDSLQVEKMILN